ncbi:MAG: TIGR02757 family protein [Deltaproteobacteria bacterium]|nr:TIGR02757 family protein [Deltaproteobacteria bacterium]
MKNLKTYLNKLYLTFDLKFLSPDPLEVVHQFKKMDNQPYKFVINFNPKKDARVFDGFIHRFNSGRDIACLVYFAKQMIERNGSIGEFFLKGYNPGDANIKNALVNFSERALSLDSSAIYSDIVCAGKKELPGNAGVRFFFPSPKDGSPCKRLNLYLRWMVRNGDSLDFGLWKDIQPCKLVIPLDTHIARISQNIGLTKRKSPDWKMAEEITENLKILDPEDPVKYDFAICRLGILEHCSKRKDFKKCEACLIKKICVL